jgi:ribose transport system substrate-binding protein
MDDNKQTQRRAVMKKVFVLFLCLMVSFAVFGAGAKEETKTESDMLMPKSCQNETPLIGVALPNTTNPYYVAMRRGFIDGAKELGFEVDVQIANDSDATQLAQIEAFVQQDVCAIALNGVKSGPAAASVATAYRAGIPVFTVNVIVSPEDIKAQGAEIVTYVGADNFAGGRQIGEEVLADFGKDTKLVVGIVTEPSEIPTVQRTKGFKEALSVNPNVIYAQEVDGNVKPDDSLRVTSEMLQANPDIDIIWADTGPHAQGALQAVKSLGVDVKVYGFAISEYPIEPLYPAAAAQEPYEYAKIVLQQIKNYLEGKEIPEEVLRPLKIFNEEGVAPAPGEVG